jgi:hypothetical protein
MNQIENEIHKQNKINMIKSSGNYNIFNIYF